MKSLILRWVLELHLGCSTRKEVKILQRSNTSVPRLHLPHWSLVISSTHQSRDSPRLDAGYMLRLGCDIVDCR